MARPRVNPPVAVGDRYGKLTVMAEAEPQRPPSGGTKRRWICRCDCGHEVNAYDAKLASGQTKSCADCLRKYPDIAVGDRYGRWTVIGAAEQTQSAAGNRHRVWPCRCDCGVKARVADAWLKTGGSTSCGCSMEMHPPVVPGAVYGRLTVVAEVERRINRRGLPLRQWQCRCECGEDTVVDDHDLKPGHTRSCGCSWREQAESLNRTHGASSEKDPRAAEYRSWMAMRARCNNPNVAAYKDYGGRGIRVCAEWDDFEAFYRDVGPRPDPKHTLDRYPDGNGDYKPGNVRWATRAEQNQNTRANVKVTVGGVELCMTEAARRAGLSLSTVRYRKRTGVPADRWFNPPTPGKKRAA